MDSFTSHFLQKLGERMIWLLEISEMTKGEFAYKFNNGKKHKGINRYFSGINMSFDTLLRVSSAFELNISFILDLENDDIEFSKYKDDLKFDIFDFIENVKLLRRKIGKTQLDLDVYTNIDRTNISKYERNKVVPRLDKIIDISSQLELKPNQLFERSKE